MLAGLSNVLEDALQLAIAVAGRGRRRLLAAIPLATLIGLFLFESGGGVLALGAWLVAGAIARQAAQRATVQAVPTST